MVKYLIEKGIFGLLFERWGVYVNMRLFGEIFYDLVNIRLVSDIFYDKV